MKESADAALVRSAALDITDMEYFKCQRCAFRCPNWRNHIRHTFEAHSNEPNFSFRCDVNGCTKTTSNYSTLSHLSRQHGDVDIESPTVHSLVTLFPQDDNKMDLDFGNRSPGLPNGEAQDENGGLHFTAQQSLKRSAALFLLTLKERYQLTQSALYFTVSQVKEMMFYHHHDKVAAINTTLGTQHAASTLTQDELGGCLEHKNPFAALETEHLQTKYYKEHCGLVVSS